MWRIERLGSGHYRIAIVEFSIWRWDYVSTDRYVDLKEPNHTWSPIVNFYYAHCVDTLQRCLAIYGLRHTEEEFKKEAERIAHHVEKEYDGQKVEEGTGGVDTPEHPEENAPSEPEGSIGASVVE